MAAKQAGMSLLKGETFGVGPQTVFQIFLQHLVYLLSANKQL